MQFSFVFWLFYKAFDDLGQPGSQYPSPYAIVYYNMAFVRDILNILAQCNRPKPSPTCTSCLGFSRLYILMLGFIVAQVIALYSYIIKM